MTARAPAYPDRNGTPETAEETLDYEVSPTSEVVVAPTFDLNHGLDHFRISHGELASLVHEVLGRGLSFRFRAEGRSMWPFIRSGDVLTVVPLDRQPLHRGAVILYQRDGRHVLAHRIVGSAQAQFSSSDRFRVRGDRLFASLEWVNADEILGVVASVERCGRRIRLSSPGARLRALVWIGLLRPLLRTGRSRLARLAGGLVAYSRDMVSSQLLAKISAQDSVP